MDSKDWMGKKPVRYHGEEVLPVVPVLGRDAFEANQDLHEAAEDGHTLSHLRVLGNE